MAIAASATLLDLRVGRLFSTGASGACIGITGSGDDNGDSSGMTSTVVVVVVKVVCEDDPSSTVITETSVVEATSSVSGISQSAWKMASSASLRGRSSSSMVDEVR